MKPVPLHMILPKGWLGEQVRLNSEGFFGHLTDISEYLTEKNGWLRWDMTAEEFSAQTGKPPEEYQSFGWEEQPYWLRGAYRLALLTGSKTLLAQCEPYFKAVLDSRRKDGYFGPECLRNIRTRTGPAVDIWPHMIMADVLRDRYLATGDERITALLQAFFHYCLTLPDDQFIPHDIYENRFLTWYPWIQLHRSCDMVPVIWWLYDLTGDSSLPALAKRCTDIWAGTPCPDADAHVVTFAQRFRYQAERYPQTKDPEDIAASKRMYLDRMAKWGQMPGGLYAADETVREGKRDPRQATETCAMAEIVRSFTRMAVFTGEAEWFDRIEDMMFNSFPASHTPDYSGLHYLTADNLPELDDRDHDYRNKGSMTRFSPFQYRCCQHNAASAWPNFASALFAETEDGVSLGAYAPCVFEGEAAGRHIRIDEETAYPFRDRISLTIRADSLFSLRLRIPGWAKDVAAAVNGIAVPVESGDGWLSLPVKDGDRVDLQFPMKAYFREFPDNGGFVCLDRGPLTYSLRLKENWIPVGAKADRAGRIWTEYDVKAEPPFTFALDVTQPVEVTETPDIPLQPFTPQSAPVVLTVRGKPLSSWKIGDDNTIEPVPASPVRIEGDLQSLFFVPLGCQRARMSCFPKLDV